MFTAEVRRGFVPILARPPPIGNMMKVKRAEGSAPPRGAGHSARRLMVENQEIQMGKRTKQERQRDAQLEATKRVGKQMLTLSVALLRVDALSEALSPVATRLAERPETQEQLGEEAFEATERLENSDLTRADGLLSLVFAALHAVVEKWREWKFSDAEVDRLLTSPHTKLLEKHRHAVFHADHYDDKNIKRFAEQKEAADWADELARAIREALRKWHADPVANMKEHLKRVGW